ncbi:tRNA (adenosine(37)-N6)-threonylcarbamoyltransferase complex dimerization subunit type 1 TsaB [Thiococcus pfennigii]|jgi:tRNA threonylcarbamoyladenosine biosynthesis protein TsaB|uniref:tRNA (adenosine(37)-N6)-threonylcarbamoyltransferase complex dimerization subunit type 1 TsaB n=1 Tax=Thiococcus pfennigii TaxID=1057 RepID=UPI001904BB3C|nr:tRNA (adenosine(37)-N6)-threonylcarbamoyltransferase complex dimerization subunit type 1 TsaB [Thiococcus pfennigii]MBK1701231.1 tRNA (adenosine(37)-N6)-threonylcarbamoyltransferase complex dimerization subunit type 1 TsaB [Thiococcus pfennigii]
MKLLAFDTSGEACSVALWCDGDVRQRLERVPRRHGELVLAMADGLLAEAGLRLAGLDALAFARGPGSFTGVRIATAVVQGAAFGADLPVVPVSTLAATARGAFRLHGAQRCLVAIDARMDQVYWGAYRLAAEGAIELEGDEAVLAPDAVPVPADAAWYGVGSGWQAYRAALHARLAGRLTGELAEVFCEAQDVAHLAADLFAREGGVAAEAALPVYLRDRVTFSR